ncbi:hypothetical protein DAPPUDRAFT_99227 [Daphnia pulex]|uniref:Uncharacterized protein n=1 Tax=Daphnia pulex TaxID=6669 RepID=E9G625_DAPPU|nr:hypothetical protein DAPPUDRAFT_99227 [Daphnia pulex]|eukprot:EFX84864.1 hypothetical protein DAPPUDRAFT_99227 [Daphnia pulex]
MCCGVAEVLDADLALPRDGVTASVLVAITLEVEVIVFAIVLPGVTVNGVAKTARQNRQQARLVSHGFDTTGVLESKEVLTAFSLHFLIFFPGIANTIVTPGYVAYNFYLAISSDRVALKTAVSAVHFAKMSFLAAFIPAVAPVPPP